MYKILITSQCGNYEGPTNPLVLDTDACTFHQTAPEPRESNSCRLLLLCWIVFLLTGPVEIRAQPPRFDVQGHRGCRGLMPENSIPAFLKALDLGVSTLELDVVVSQDNQVVVSHDFFINGAFCLTPEGEPVDKKKQKNLALFQMTYEQIRQYDCGSKGNSDFPEQQRISVCKPLLSDVIKQAESYREQRKLPLFSYNIEIKSQPSGYGHTQPPAEILTKLVYRVVSEHLPPERVIIQSFDFSVLRYCYQQIGASAFRRVRLSALISNLKSINSQLKKLGFVPDICSPHFRRLNPRRVKQLHAQGMQVIPWTVNDPGQMRKLKQWGVDGLITDFPDRARNL